MTFLSKPLETKNVPDFLGVISSRASFAVAGEVRVPLDAVVRRRGG